MKVKPVVPGGEGRESCQPRVKESKEAQTTMYKINKNMCTTSKGRDPVFYKNKWNMIYKAMNHHVAHLKLIL